MMKAVKVFVFASVLFGCSSNPASPLDPFSPEITRAVDNFELQATNVVDVTTSADYAWENTGTSANIDQSTITSTGTATLVILDDSGAEVYNAALAPSGSVSTSAGTSGTWTIRLILGNYDGTLNFRAQKP
jgi:hypothetical protein